MHKQYSTQAQDLISEFFQPLLNESATSQSIKKCLSKVRQLVVDAPEGTSFQSRKEIARDYLKSLKVIPDSPVVNALADNITYDILAAILDSNNPITSLASIQRLGNIPWPELRRMTIAVMQKLGFKRPEVETHLGQVPLETVTELLREIVVDGLPSSQVHIRLTRLAEDSGHPAHTLRAIYKDLVKECDRAETQSIEALEVAAKLPNAMTARRARLPIAEALTSDGGVLAREIIRVAKAMPTVPEYIVTALLPVLATSIGTSSRIIVKSSAQFVETMNFWAMIVCLSGCLKTPILKAAISGISCLEEAEAARYNAEREDYERNLAAYLEAQRGDRADLVEPTPPRDRRRRIETDGNLASRIKLHHSNPRGILRFRDEGSAFLAELGRHHNGKGDGGETEADLSEFNGGAIEQDRIGRDTGGRLNRTGFQRLGAIQPSILKKLRGDHQDDRGQWARNLFCAVDTPYAYLNLTADEPDSILPSLLEALHLELEKQPQQDYLLSDAARLPFQDYYNRYRAIVAETSQSEPGTAAAAAKMGTYLCRITLWLHLVNAALARTEPALTIAPETVEMAAKWTAFYWSQNQLLMARLAPANVLTGNAMRVVDLLSRKGTALTRSEITRGTRIKKAPLSEILSILVEQAHIVADGAVNATTTKYAIPIAAPVCEAPTKIESELIQIEPQINLQTPYSEKVSADTTSGIDQLITPPSSPFVADESPISPSANEAIGIDGLEVVNG
jgi:hypothetical protein